MSLTASCSFANIAILHPHAKPKARFLSLETLDRGPTKPGSELGASTVGKVTCKSRWSGMSCTLPALIPRFRASGWCKGKGLVFRDSGLRVYVYSGFLAKLDQTLETQPGSSANRSFCTVILCTTHCEGVPILA